MTTKTEPRWTWQGRRVSVLPYLLILPTLVFVILFTIYPTLRVVENSQEYYHPNRPDRSRETDLNLPGIASESRSLQGPHEVGIAYFRAMFDPSTPEGEIFFQVIGNTLLYTMITVPVSMGLAFLFALLVNRQLRFIGLARVALFYPTMLPLVSAATIWLFFFTPEYGLWNEALRLFGYSGAENWIINKDLGLSSLMIVAIWKNAGYFMIFYLAGLQSLPQDVFEAARLDGANWWAQLRSITLPLLRRTTLFISVVAIINAFQNIDHALVLTNELVTGEADLLLYEIYEQRFQLQNYGFSNALTIIMILLLLVFTLSNFYLSERTQGE